MNPNAWSTDPDSNATVDPPIQWPEGQSPGSVNNSARAMMAAVACLLKDTSGTLTAGGFLTGPGANIYNLALNRTIGPGSGNFELAFFVDRANTAPAELAVNGLLSNPILRRHGRVLGPGDLTPGVLYRASYIAASGSYILTSPEIAAPGTIRLQAGLEIDPGWLPCDGRTVSRSTYAALLAAIAFDYGAGDGSTTFAIPDLRGRTPFGRDAGANRLTGVGGLNGNLGNGGGAETVTLSPAQMPRHSHGGTAQEGGGTPAGTTGSAGDHNHGGQVGSGGGHTHDLSIASGGAHAHTGTANTAGGQSRGFSFENGSGAIPGGGIPYVVDINAYDIYGNKRVTSTDPGHTHDVTIASSGAHTHSGTASQAADHQHSIPASGAHSHSVPAVPAHAHALTIDQAGGDQAHSNIPPGLVLQFVIKT